MKVHIVLSSIVLSIPLISACSAVQSISIDEADCDNVWFSMFQYDVVLGLRPTQSEILNKEHPPNSVGEFLKGCIRGGWQPIDQFDELDLFTCDGKYDIYEAIQRNNFPIDSTFKSFVDAPVSEVINIKGNSYC